MHKKLTSYPQSNPKKGLSGCPELSKFRCEIFLNTDFSGNRVALLDGYSTMKTGADRYHHEPENPVKALLSFAKRLIANAYFTYESVGNKKIYRTQSIVFRQIIPNAPKDDHPTVLILTPQEFIIYGAYEGDMELRASLNELYQIMQNGDISQIKRNNYTRRTDEMRDFTFKGKTYDDLTKHCELLVKKYDRKRVVAWWRTIRDQYFSEYSHKTTELVVEAKNSGLGYPEQVQSIQNSMLKKFTGK